VKDGDSLVVDFPRFEGSPDQLPRTDVMSVEICVDGSIIYESGGLMTVEMPLRDDAAPAT
jgi:hypothetical protein